MLHCAMGMYMKVKREYKSGPSAGEVETVHIFVGPYASQVLDAQDRRGNAPIIRITKDGDIVHEYDFEETEDDEHG